MEQVFEEYIYWEDYINGMYDPPKKENEVSLAIEMLRNNALFLETCKEVLINWPVSSKVNLTNNSCNRKAWLGQACCSYKYKVPEISTRIAWGMLSIEQQSEANKIAEQIINSFEINYEGQNTQLY